MKENLWQIILFARLRRMDRSVRLHLTTRDLVEEARKAHNTSPVATAALGRLLTAGGMMGSMMKGEDDLLTHQDPGRWPYGRTDHHFRFQRRCERVCV